MKQAMPNAENARLPAAFRRLCVETAIKKKPKPKKKQPPLGGCVLKQSKLSTKTAKDGSRL